MTPLTLAQPHIQGIIQQQQQQHAQQHQQQIQQKTIISKAGATVVSMDVLEQKQWWHLEEVKCAFGFLCLFLDFTITAQVLILFTCATWMQ